MKYYLFFLQILGFNFSSFSQSLANTQLAKSVLDTSVFSNWPSLYRYGLSNNGEYVYFTTAQGGKHNNENLIISSLNGKWKADTQRIRESIIKFSNDNENLYCINSGDSLCIISLGKHINKYVASVQSFDLVNLNGKEYLIYQLKSEHSLILQNLETGKQLSFKNVSAYLINDEKNTLIIKVDSIINGKKNQLLIYNDLTDNSTNKICQGNTINNLILNKRDNKLVFIKEDNGLKSIWSYNPQTNGVQILSDSEIENKLQIERILSFNKDGSKLFIYLKDRPLSEPNQSVVKLNVWSYQDEDVQSRQPNNTKSKSYLAVVNLNDLKLIQLQNENEIINPVVDKNNEFIFGYIQNGDYRESLWNQTSIPKSFLVSIEDNRRIELKNSFISPQISPDGDFIIGYDLSRQNIYSYEFSTGKATNLTKSLPITLPSNIQREIADRPIDKEYRGLNFAAWEEGHKVLIYDEFDIWELDLKGKSVPVNITKGFGRKNKIEFKLTDLNGGFDSNKMPSSNERIIVHAFDRVNKNEGIYQIISGKEICPKLLSMGNYSFRANLNIPSPIKAKNAEIYLIQRESATESSNLYWTYDFKTYNRISSIFPEKAFNWLTAELKTFKTLDGRTEHGVLFKPEDFNPQKKYPLLIHYYERKSNELNKFQSPGTDGDLDIAWFVSHGYLAFTPDIHYKIGEPGKSTYNSVIAAANFVKSLPFVNPNKIGIQGHSWGGYETNYLVANSKMFAAAISSSGISNFITGYLSDIPNEQFHCEASQMRLGKMLWEDESMYMSNSPVFNAYKVSTPILIIHNEKDYNVPFIQGLEWFMALRRLGKRAWMLQYDNGGHGLAGSDYIDYIIRSTQFFDHCLKDSACPKWMLYGIPKKQKGVENGLDLVREKDKNGMWLTPKEGGILTNEQKRKVNALQKRK